MSDPEETDDALSLLDDEHVDVYMSTALTLAGGANPLGALAVVIGHLTTIGGVSPSQLSLLGIDEDELADLTQAFLDNSNLDELTEDLATATATRHYRRELDAIGRSLRIEPGTDAYRTLQRNLAGFAVDNDIDDIRIAFRLMKAERPDLVPDPETP
jgi:hypothetical protein